MCLHQSNWLPREGPQQAAASACKVMTARVGSGSDKTVEVQYPSLGKQAKKNFTFDGTFDETT